MTIVRWCIEDDCYSDRGCCGGLCDEYSPRNGRSGICKHHRKMRMGYRELTHLISVGYAKFIEEREVKK